MQEDDLHLCALTFSSPGSRDCWCSPSPTTCAGWLPRGIYQPPRANVVLMCGAGAMPLLAQIPYCIHFHSPPHLHLSPSQINVFNFNRLGLTPSSVLLGSLWLVPHSQGLINSVIWYSPMLDAHLKTCIALLDYLQDCGLSCP